MLDIAISIDTDALGTTLIETNHGTELKTSDWPSDCEYQLVAFDPSRKTCEVICPEMVADDIRSALQVLQAAGELKSRKPDWYRRLSLYAKGE